MIDPDLVAYTVFHIRMMCKGWGKSVFVELWGGGGGGLIGRKNLIHISKGEESANGGGGMLPSTIHAVITIN